MCLWLCASWLCRGGIEVGAINVKAAIEAEARRRARAGATFSRLGAAFRESTSPCEFTIDDKLYEDFQ
jgi:hypothetical protein